MKIAGVLIAFLYTPLTVPAQDDTASITFSNTRTEACVAIGEKQATKIGKDGGRIISPDGRMELVIPAGALPSKTSISLQYCTNMAPGGAGLAYTLEPATVHFLQPAQIIFHYNKNELANSMEGLQQIAYQDETGQWYRIRNVQQDTVNKTVSGPLHHFSHWALFSLAVIAPAAARVKVNNKIQLKVILNFPPGSPGSISIGQKNDDLATPKPSKPPRLKWAVNGQTGGNAVAGWVNPTSGNQTTFTAPASVPDQNPVAVSVESDNGAEIDNSIFKRLKLVSNITIIDKTFLITVVGHNSVDQAGVGGTCHISSFDSSSCLLQLNGSKTKLQDIQNMNCRVTINNCGCNVSELIAGACTGPVNIVGSSRIDVQPPNPPARNYALITVYFTRNMGAIPPMQAQCPGQPHIVGVGMPFVAVPTVLQFEAKPEAQTLMKGGDEKNGFEVKVEPLNGDQ